MKTPNDQPELPNLQPRELVVASNDLAAVLSDLKVQGAVIEAMDVKGATYTLHIFWPRCGCELCVPPTVPSGAALPVLQTSDDR